MRSVDSARERTHSRRNSLDSGSSNYFTASANVPSVFRSVRSSATVDVHASMLSARGSQYNEIVEDDGLCFVCFDNQPNAILLECGHGGMCLECASRTLDSSESHDRGAMCPICRSAITRVLKIRRDKPLPKGFFKPADTTAPRSSHRCHGIHASPASPDILEPGVSGHLFTIPSDPEADLVADVATSVLGNGPPWPRVARRQAVVVEVYKNCSMKPKKVLEETVEGTVEGTNVEVSWR